MLNGCSWSVLQELHLLRITHLAFRLSHSLYCGLNDAAALTSFSGENANKIPSKKIHLHFRYSSLWKHFLNHKNDQSVYGAAQWRCFHLFLVFMLGKANHFLTPAPYIILGKEESKKSVCIPKCWTTPLSIELLNVLETVSVTVKKTWPKPVANRQGSRHSAIGSITIFNKQSNYYASPSVLQTVLTSPTIFRIWSMHCLVICYLH